MPTKRKPKRHGLHMHTPAMLIQRERLADDALNRALALDRKVKDATYAGLIIKVRGRGVAVRRTEEKFVVFDTWSEGRGFRRMRCSATWRHWRLRYFNG